MPTRSNNMSDPQNDSVESEVIEPVIETNDSVVESETTAPVEGESEQQVDEVELAKKKSNDAFNKQYGQLKQGERDLASANEKIANFEQGERERQEKQAGDIPPMPEEFDDNYAEKLQAHIDGKTSQAVYISQNKAFLQQQQNQQIQTQQAQQVEFNKKLTVYSNRANELGINAEELQVAANTVGSYGLSDDLIKHIVSDPDGPLITKHLAANPIEASELINMSPYAIGSKLDAIKKSAAALKPRTSNTPDPVETLKGNGVIPDDGYKNLKGAKFE